MNYTTIQQYPYKENANIEMDVGSLINHIRHEKNISLAKLCKGVCSEGYLSGVINGKKYPYQSIISLLLQRLGLDENEFESYLSYPEYRMFIAQKHIFELLENKEIESAKREIDFYRKREKKQNRFNKRFLLLAYTGVMYLENNKNEEVIELIKQAIQVTVPSFLNKPLEELILGTDEIFFILEYARLTSDKCDGISSQKICEDVIKYLDKSDISSVAKAKLYPKAVCLINKKYFVNKQYEIVLKNCEAAISYLRNSGKLYYMVELLEDKINALEKKIDLYNNYKSISDDELIKIVKFEKLHKEATAQKEVLCEMFSKYNVKKDFLQWYTIQHTREVYLKEKIIKIRRNMLMITRNKLSEAVCGLRTVVRLENEGSSVSPKISKLILYELNLSGELHNSCIMSSDYEAHKLRNKIDELMILLNYKEANGLLNKLSEKIDLSNNINKQYIEHSETLICLNLDLISKEEAINRYVHALELTLSTKYIFRKCKKYFSKRELIIMSNIANAYEKIKDYDNAAKWFEMLESYYENIDCDIDNCIITYELIMSNYESFLGNIGNYEKSNKIIEKILPVLLESKRGWFLTNYMFSLSWNRMMKIKDNRELLQNEKESYTEDLRKTLTLSFLMNDSVVQEFLDNEIKNYS